MGMRFKRLLNDERGSISILIFSLFTLALITSLLLTDVSSIYLAKRSLTQAVEAAAQRGSGNLDQRAYYSGKYNLTSAIESLLGGGEKDPGIPIDCGKGIADVELSLRNWSNGGKSLTRVNMSSISIDSIECDGFQISITASALANLPIVFPFIDINKVRIVSSIGAVDERKSFNIFFG